MFLIIYAGRMVDHMIAWIARCLGGKSSCFFADGFGKLCSLIEVDSFIHSIIDGKTQVLPLSVDIGLETYDANKNHDTFDCSFISPASFFLPETVHMAYFHLMKPHKNTELKGIIIMLPHTGDELYEYRKKIAYAGNLIELGYAVIITMAPFYGKRRGPNQHLYFIRSVELFIKAAAAAMVETAAIVQWAKKTFPKVKVCVAGISNGGCMAAYTAFITHDRLSVATVVGTDSAVVLTDGPLSLQIDWPALAKERPARAMTAIKEELRAILSSRSVSSLAVRRGKSYLHNTVCVNAKNDAFIDIKEACLLHSAMRRISCTKVDWVSGGHITSTFVNPARLIVPAIIHAFGDDASADDAKED
jgi:hypothetical protein